MDYELYRANKLAKKFDKDLMARRNIDGTLQICQMVRKWEPIDICGLTVLYPYESPHLVFNCTDNWSANGTPVSWGYEPLYQKLREISLDRRDALFQEMEIIRQKSQDAKERALRNKCEDIAYETRDIFKKTFSDVNTSTMDKSKDVRRKIDRSIKWQ